MLKNKPPAARLLVGPGCPHCAAELADLAELVKRGDIARLEVINVAVDPQAAQGVRSVPWLRLGPYVLPGRQGAAALAWYARHRDARGARRYLEERLAAGELETALVAVRDAPALLEGALQLLAAPEADLRVRLGAMAILEALAGSPALAERVEALAALARHADARVRADAAHALALSGAAAARPHLEALLHDPDATVREVAAEGLQELRGD